MRRVFMTKIIQYRNKCIGCGICMEMQPDHWRMSTRDGRATLVMGENKNERYIKVVPDSMLQRTQRVATACPVNCIKVV